MKKFIVLGVIVISLFLNGMNLISYQNDKYQNDKISTQPRNYQYDKKHRQNKTPYRRQLDQRLGVSGTYRYISRQAPTPQTSTHIATPPKGLQLYYIV